MLARVLIFAFAVAVTSVLAAPKSKYVRPCQLNDYHCIRDNLSANSKCSKKVQGSIPARYTQPLARFETPYFNSSYIDQNLVITNHNRCYVSEFFFNMESDAAVLAVDCRNIGFQSNRTLIQHNSLKEDTRYSYKINAVYPLVRMTVNLNHADTLDICSAFVFTDVAALPIFTLDPNDKPTANFLSQDLTFLNIYERETFFYRGPSLFKYFINSYICNFGCQ